MEIYTLTHIEDGGLGRYFQKQLPDASRKNGTIDQGNSKKR